MPVNNIYAEWEIINNYVEASAKSSHYPSFVSGNNYIIKPVSIPQILVEASHDSLRGVMNRLGNLYKPKNQSVFVRKAYEQLQSHRKDYGTTTSRLKKTFETIYGKNSSRSQKSNAKSTNTASCVFFDDKLHLLKHISEGKTRLNLKQKLNTFFDTMHSSYAEQKTKFSLTNFKQQNDLEYKIFLTNSMGRHLVWPNKAWSTYSWETQAVENNSLAHNLFLLKSISEQDIDDTDTPIIIAKSARISFGQTSNIYRNVRTLLDNANLSEQPIILQEFQIEKDKLAQRIAGQCSYHELSELNKKNSLVFELTNALGLENVEKFDMARAAYEENRVSKSHLKPQHSVRPKQCPMKKLGLY